MFDFGMDDGSGIGGFELMGIINALKTGNAQMDILVAVCMPIIIRRIFQWLTCFDMQSAVDAMEWIHWIGPRQYERFIVHKTGLTNWGDHLNLEKDSQNSILIKAIRLYINQVLRLTPVSAPLDFTSVEDKSSSIFNSRDGPCNDFGPSEFDQDDTNDNPNGNAKESDATPPSGTLGRFQVITGLPKNKWQTLGAFGPRCGQVRLRVKSKESEGSRRGDGGGAASWTSKVTFHFKSSQPDAIDAFIDTAHQWYVAELQKMEDHARYYYDLKASKPPLLVLASKARNNDDFDERPHDSNQEGTTYRRFKLSDQKTFDSLFFPQKKSIISLIDSFTNRTGKYAIHGFPHKLGFLLHGPPGTGKTSLIKAIAQYTKRSIVNVPLSKVRTNAELMSIFFDKKYRIEGSDVAVNQDFKDVIFVMEDVDAVSTIVQRRDQSFSDVSQNTTCATMDASYDADSVNRHSSHDENDSCNSGDGYDDDGYDDGSTINRDDDNQHGLTDYTWDKDSKKSLWRHFLESTDEDSKAVVKLLVQRSERLLKEAKGCTILADLVDHAMSAPGMQGGSQSSSKTSRHKTSTSINDLGAYMEHRQTLHSYISEQARSICNLLDLGVPINDAFVDRLLAVPKEDEEKNHPASSSPPDGEDNAVAMSAPAKNDSSPKGLPSVDKTKPVHAQSGPPASPTAFAGGLSNDKTDALSLAGILNVLDGVVDTPSRLLIMTTNHPEMLDDALIRPGRIDKNIRMGYMASQEVAEMLEHYFQTTLDGAQRCRIRCLVGEDGAGSDDGGTRQANMASSRRLTPAQVEQMVVEYESVDDVIGRLESLP